MGELWVYLCLTIYDERTCKASVPVSFTHHRDPARKFFPAGSP